MQHHVILIGPQIIKELRKNLDQKLKLPGATIDGIVDLILASCEMVEPSIISNDACRDPTDLHVIGTAEAGRADCIVTGDPDLLTIQRHKWVEIHSPRVFWERMAKS